MAIPLTRDPMDDFTMPHWCFVVFKEVRTGPGRLDSGGPSDPAPWAEIQLKCLGSGICGMA